MGIAAVRGDDPRRRDLRARIGRRQGSGLHAPEGGRGASHAERPAAGEHEAHSGRRGRGRQRQPGRLHPRAQERARGRPRGHLGHVDVRSGCSVDLLRPARPGLLPDRPARQQGRPALRRIRRRRRQPVVRTRADDRADEGSQRPDQDSRLLRRCPADGRGRAAGMGAAVVQREEIPEGFRDSQAVRRDRIHARSSGRGRGRRWR